MAVHPWLLIVPERKNDAALIAHEQVHLDEQATGVVRWWWKYLTSASFRLDAEVRAYRVQIELGGISPEHAATLIADRYGLDVSYSRALSLVTT